MQSRALAVNIVQVDEKTPEDCIANLNQEVLNLFNEINSSVSETLEETLHRFQREIESFQATIEDDADDIYDYDLTISCGDSGKEQFNDLVVSADQYNNETTQYVAKFGQNFAYLQSQDLETILSECNENSTKCRQNVLTICEQREKLLPNLSSVFTDFSGAIQTNIAGKYSEFEGNAKDIKVDVEKCMASAVYKSAADPLAKLLSKIGDYKEELEEQVRTIAYDVDDLVYDQERALQNAIEETEDAISDEDKENAQELGCDLTGTLSGIYKEFERKMDQMSNDVVKEKNQQQLDSAESKLNEYFRKIKEHTVKLENCAKDDIYCMLDEFDFYIYSIHDDYERNVVSSAETALKAIKKNNEDMKKLIEETGRSYVSLASQNGLFNNCSQVAVNHLESIKLKVLRHYENINGSIDYYVNSLITYKFNYTEKVNDIINTTRNNITTLRDNLKLDCKTNEVLQNVTLFRNLWIEKANSSLDNFADTLSTQNDFAFLEFTDVIKLYKDAIANCTPAYKCLNEVYKKILTEDNNVDVTFKQIEYFAATSFDDVQTELNDPTKECYQILHFAMRCLYSSSAVAPQVSVLGLGLTALITVISFYRFK